MKKKMVVGIFFGALLVYLSVRGINFQDVADGFKNIQYGYVIAVLIALILMQALRSWRWGVILSPLEKVDQLSLFSVTSVGFLAIVAIPARLGELARPYLITHKSQIRMTAAIGSVLVERVFDCLTILFIFVFALFFTPLPPWLILTGTMLFLITLCIFTTMIFMILKREVSLSALNSLFKKLPDKYMVKLNHLFHQFIDGFKIITDVKLLILLTVLSALIWLIDAAAIYFMFLAFGFTLPFAAPFVVMIILMIGITIPTAPGFVGNWHYSCILGLSLFGIPKTDAFTFSVIFHFISIGIVIVLGLLFLPFNKFSLSDLKQQGN
ncbi:MAG: lysylphosphatidylglycerol synthase transmembrane domain-containing protein [Deltaproteobacteria bacterium]|nr:lysylphosphatidylglycerol synthase transmembrane domain-containing protein [Deltaproteobacteria bacterium]